MHERRPSHWVPQATMQEQKAKPTRCEYGRHKKNVQESLLCSARMRSGKAGDAKELRALAGQDLAGCKCSSVQRPVRNPKASTTYEKSRKTESNRYPPHLMVSKHMLNSGQPALLSTAAFARTVHASRYCP